MYRPRPLPLWPWGLVGFVTVPLAIAALVTFGRVSGFVVFGDAEWYATAAPAIVSDQPLYPQDKLAPHEFGLPHYWNQPPSTALVTPILLLPGGRWIWGGLMVACVLVGLALIWPRVGPGGAMLLGPVLLVWLPVASALAWANVNAAVFALLALAWRFPKTAGWAIGIAAAVKLAPIFGIGWLIGKREWRKVLVAVAIPVSATLAVAAWKGPETILDFVSLRLNEVTPPGDRPRWNPVELFELPDWVAYASAGALVVMAVHWSSLSLSILAMLVSVPALHSHYLVWLGIPILGIWLPWLLGWRTMRSAQQA